MPSDAVQVSVVIPAYNCAHVLPEAVDSIRRQNHPALEIIVVNDGSTDETSEVAAALGGEVRCIHQANGGCSAARNAGVKAALGEFVGFLDADDLWPEGTLLQRLRILNDSSNAGIVFGKTQALSQISAVAGGLGNFEPFALPWHITTLGSVLCRRHVVETVGPFDTSMEAGEDVDWFLRAWQCGVETIFIEAVTLLYRMHSGSLTAEAGSKSRSLLRALKRSLDRRREKEDGIPVPLSLRAPIPSGRISEAPVVGRES